MEVGARFRMLSLQVGAHICAPHPGHCPLRFAAASKRCLPAMLLDHVAF